MEFDLYKDIQKRTNGEIYIGVVGPVRTGKSTFIKRFMDLFVLPYIEDEEEKKRTLDELPQSAAGKTIMTTEPKFIPQEAAEITLADESSVSVRLIDCVGFMVEGANGHLEGDGYRIQDSICSKSCITVTNHLNISRCQFQFIFIWIKYYIIVA